MLSTLENSIQESSGLIYLDGKIITHNDSGDDPVLYEIDSLTGNVVRTVTVNNASHVDWEDICYDDTYIYIGDFGNNSGSRTDLKIYRISISDYQETENDEANAEEINFSYPDQTDFTSGSNETNFDAEALISYGDSLYIFSKRWLDNQSAVYSLPKEPGTYSANPLGMIFINGLITGATYNSVSGNVMLIGYSFILPFIVTIADIEGSDFVNANIERQTIDLPSGISVQAEAITAITGNTYYLSSEQSVLGSPGLCKMVTDEVSNTSNIQNLKLIIYPNPAIDYFRIDHEDFYMAEIYSGDGRLVKRVRERVVGNEGMDVGVYLVVVRDEELGVLGMGRVVFGGGNR